jgi:hypothetical protein
MLKWQVKNLPIDDLEDELNRLMVAGWNVWPQTIQITSRGECPYVMLCASMDEYSKKELEEDASNTQNV